MLKATAAVLPTRRPFLPKMILRFPPEAEARWQQQQLSRNKLIFRAAAALTVGFQILNVFMTRPYEEHVKQRILWISVSISLFAIANACITFYPRLTFPQLEVLSTFGTIAIAAMLSRFVIFGTDELLYVTEHEALLTMFLMGIHYLGQARGAGRDSSGLLLHPLGPGPLPSPAIGFGARCAARRPSASSPSTRRAWCARVCRGSCRSRW